MSVIIWKLKAREWKTPAKIIETRWYSRNRTVPNKEYNREAFLKSMRWLLQICAELLTTHPNARKELFHKKVTDILGFRRGAR